MSLRRPSKCSVPVLCMISFWGGRLDGVSGKLGFPLERWVSLMLVMMLISAVGVNRTLLRRLLGGRFALAFRREVFASLDHCSRDFANKQTMSSEQGSA